MDIKSDKWKKQILEIIAESTEPVGSWFIVNTFKDRGVEVSSATIGRELNQLESLGLVEKQNFKGRLITRRGREVIAEANSSLEIDYHKSRLDEMINSNVLDNFLMVLEARQAIERKTVSLAAQRITPEELRELEECVKNQQVHKESHKSIAADDIAFHSGIARASKNKVLFSLYMILSSMGQQSELFENLRMKVGDSYSSLHQKILQALREHNSGEAERFMLLHIERLMEDVNRYWHEYRPQDGR